jgi:hypothetical protein
MEESLWSSEQLLRYTRNVQNFTNHKDSSTMSQELCKNSYPVPVESTPLSQIMFV